MITKNEIDFPAYQQTGKLVELEMYSRLLVYIVRLLNAGTNAYKLEFYEKMLNFIRVIGLKALSANLHIKLNRNLSQGHVASNYEERVSCSFVNFLFQLEIITPGEEGLTINADYQHLMDDEVIKNLSNHLENPQLLVFSKKEKKALNDFLIINDLMQKYSNPEYSFQHIKKHRHIWESLVVAKKLDYEIRLCETLFNLINLRIPEKIENPFDEDYYTESGQNAFKNFIRYSFLKYLQEITNGRKPLNIFDLGCGYGNYIEVIHENFPDCSVTGIERNSKVFAHTRSKFEKAKNVEIINDDFFDFNPSKKYDVVLMNFVLFYFDFKKKRKALKKAKSMLADQGSIVICQYFSGIEALKKELAKKQKDCSVAKKIEMYYSDKILYANTLWNDAVDTFSEAVKWDEFLSIISTMDLQIISMTNADKFYYSLFVELKVAQ